MEYMASDIFFQPKFVILAELVAIPLTIVSLKTFS
jgi:hypothetical protein